MPNQNDNRTVPGFTVYHDLNSPTGESYHCHEYHEVIFFLSGEGRYVVEGKTYRLQPGDLLVISDREIHRDSEKSGKRRDRYIAYIDSAFLEEAKKADRNGEDLSRCFDVLSGRRYHLLRLGAQERKRAAAIFAALAEANPQGYGADLLKKCYMIELLVMLNRACFSEDEPEEALCNPKIQCIVEFINTHLDGDLNLELLSARFGLSKYHMTREFKRCLGLSLHQYVLKKRLLEARAALRQGQTAAQAFALSGFSDYSHFSRAFRETFGMSPREYRLKVKEGSFSMKVLFE